MTKKKPSSDELWINPWWVAIVSTTVSLSTFLLYGQLTSSTTYEDGYIPALLIPVILSPTIVFLIRKFVKRIKNGNRKLSELNTTHRKLISVLTHDLRSPLSSVKSAMELMFLGILDEHELERMGQKLTEDVDNVLKLQNQILEWAKRQEGVKSIKIIHFEIGEPIQSIINMYAQQIKAKELDIEVNHFNNTVYTDKEVFEFVFRNVFYNALKYTPKGGEITVRSYVKDNICELCKEDNGIRMSQKMIDKVMNTKEFHSSLGTGNEDGTGFGLNASLQYLRECNASLSVRSTPGVGSSFKISLPVRPER